MKALLCLLFVVGACAHTQMTGFINAAGTSTMNCVRPMYPGFDATTGLGSQWPIQQSNLLSNGLLSDNYTCGFLPFAAQPATSKCAVAAGDNVAVSYLHGAYGTEDPVLDKWIARSHKGPFIVYMAKSDTGKGNVWFKVFQQGKIAESATFDNVKWASPDTLLANNGAMKFQIPADISPGNYLLRTEIIAMHDTSKSGSQPYINCVELTVSGSGTANPAGVPIPGTVGQDDPGLSTQYNIYTMYQQAYPFPGPSVYVAGKTSAAPQTSTSTTTTATPATSTPPDVPTINVDVVVSVNMAQNIVDLTSFVYEVTQVLDVPTSAISNIEVNLAQSTSTVTVINFTFTNVLRADGYTRVDPLKAAQDLQDMVTNKDQKLQQTAMLSSMQVLSVEAQPTASSGSAFVGSTNFIIMVCVIGGLVIIAAAVVVSIVLLRKRRNSSGFM